MPLSRILFSVLSVMMLVFFSASLWIGIHATRQYVEAQLASHAQDAATSLGIAITTALGDGDAVAMERLTSAMFDRGYYRQISVRAPDGRVLLERSLPVAVEGVPGWFVNRIPLDTPAGKAAVMNGWKQVGTVEVRSHTGYAYAKLWDTALGMLWLCLGGWFAASALLAVLLRMVLAPLREVEAMADAVSRREFPASSKRPRVRELRRVVEAMNAMSAKVKTMFAAEAELTAAIREEAHRDPLTGLANRRSFLARLDHLVASPDEFPGGALMLVQVEGLGEFNKRAGRTAGDRALLGVAQAMHALCAGRAGAVMARLDGGLFALLVPGLTHAECASIAQQLAGADTDDLPGTKVGAARFDGGGNAAAMLARADAALRRAPAAGWACDEGDVDDGHWRAILERALASGELELHFQSVVGVADGRTMHAEVLARLRDAAGGLHPAAGFMAPAMQMGVLPRFDRLMVERVLAHLSGAPGDADFALNLALASLADGDFLDALCAMLAASPQEAARLAVELPEPESGTGAVHLCAAFDRLRATGCRVGLDHFGVGFGSFDYLIDLKPDYVKIDGSLVRGIAENGRNRFYVHALTKVAQGLGIRVIACAVEGKSDLAVLRRIGVDGAQGFHVGAPSAEMRHDGA